METNKDIIKRLKQLSQEAGSQAALAAKIGISTPYLSDVINGRRDPGPAIRQFLGIQKVVGYTPIACKHEHVQSAFEGQGVNVVEYLECADCHKDLRGELPEPDPATLADQLANEEE
jgi:transcriptional regulator with XRE-family HTH domain